MAALTTTYQFLAVDRFSATLKKMNGVLAKTSQRVSKLSEAATRMESVAGSVATGILSKEIIQAGANFEFAMDGVAAMSGAVGKEFNSLTATAKDLGSKTRFTATEVANGMSFLALAGYDANQIMGAIPSTLDLAAAANLDLARASDIASDMTTAFGYSAEQTNIVVDQLAKTQSSFNTTVEQTFEAMKYMVPAANTLNISMAESNALIGAMANSGLKGGIATRAFATSLFRLAKPTAEMADAFKYLNIDLFTSEGKFVGVTKTIDILSNKMANFNDEQRTATLSTLFGAEAVKSWNILLETGSGKLTEYTKKINESSGAAKKMAEIRQRGVLGAFVELKSAIEFGFIESSTVMFADLNKAIRNTADSVRNITRSFTELNPGLQQAISYSIQFILVIGPILLGLAGLVAVFKTVMFGLAPVIAGIKLLGGLFATITTGVSLLSLGMVTVSTVLSGVVASVLAVTAAFYGLKEVFSWFLDEEQTEGQKAAAANRQAAFSRAGLGNLSSDDIRNLPVERLQELARQRREQLAIDNNINSTITVEGLPQGASANVQTRMGRQDIGRNTI